MHANTIPARLLMQAQVVVLAAPGAVDLLTYAVPRQLLASIAPGHRVLVPLRSRHVTGIVVELGEQFAPNETQLRAIAEQIDSEPILDEPHMRLMRFAANYYMASLSEAYRAAIPGAFRIETRTTISLSHKPDPLALATFNVIEKSIVGALSRAPLTTRSLARFGNRSQVNRAIATLDSHGLLDRSERIHGRHREPRPMLVRAAQDATQSSISGTIQKAVMKALIESSPAPVAIDRLEAIIPTARSTIRRLVARGLVEVLNDPQFGSYQAKPPVLSEEQAAAVCAVLAPMNKERFESFLLWGITASGKTEVYLRLAAECLKAGRKVLILVPEIALTDYLVGSFSERFGQTVAVAHSGQNISERWESWRAAIKGFARVMIGPRSALFAPIRDLGLIVVDEEHDSAYKQEEGIRYNARDLAVALAQFSNCPIVLGSATPSAESFANARRGRYRLLRLTRRIEDRPFANVKVIDLREESRRPAKSPFDGPPAASPSETRRAEPKLLALAQMTIEALGANLKAGQQSIVFINRRGYHSFLQCHRCGAVLTCPNCSVCMTFHFRDHSLRCHYCGERTAAPGACPECRELGLEGQGFGTERLVSELALRFPAARIERIDSDTGRRTATRKGILEALRRGQVDILVGTQMITKGFDFPGVTLVVAVAADLALNLPDFRSAERTFQLLTQVAGRAGRGKWPGQVIIQTFAPTHYSIRAAREQDYLRFMRRELQLRRELCYPPYVRMALLRFEGDAAAQVEAVAAAASAALRSAAEVRPAVRILGPAPAPIERIKRRYRWQLIVKAPSVVELHTTIAAARTALDVQAERAGVRLSLDLDPINMM